MATKKKPTADDHSKLKDILSVLRGVLAVAAAITPIAAAPFVDEEDAAKIKASTDAAAAILGALPK